MSQLTYREAAARVHRSTRAIRRWRLQGMVMGWDIRDGQRVRVVEEQALLAWYRRTLANDPVHQQRLRVMLREDATRRAENS